jgi:uncharacterized protein YabE (DUF348 family)
VRRTFALLTKSKAALAVIAGAVGLTIAATGIGYAAMSKTVTLSVDGHPHEVSTLGNTVGDVLDSQDISVGKHDVVAPGLGSQINDGSNIAVRFGRPLKVNLDGNHQRYWVTATDVSAALSQIGVRYGNADLSASRSATIGRQGLALTVVTPKKLVIAVGGKKPHHQTLTALTTHEALKKLGVKVDKNDLVKPGLGATLKDGDKIVVTKVRKVTRRVTQSVGFGTVKHTDSSMFSGQTKTVRAGHDGSRHVVYRLIYHNGKVVARKVLHSKVTNKPVSAIVRVGSKSRPAPTNFAGGSTVWDRLAGCESGGNWAENTGNGYYGGLQFDLSTWHSYGGSGYPNQASRSTQIAIGTKVRDANGGYSAWPSCASQLGLPQ